MSNFDPTVFPPQWNNDQNAVMTEHGIVDFLENAVHEVVMKLRDDMAWADLPEEVKAFRTVLAKEADEKRKIITSNEATVDWANVETFDARTGPAVQILSRNQDRRGVIIANHNVGIMYVSFGVAAVNAADHFTVQIPVNSSWVMPQPFYTGILYAVWSATGSPGASITELHS